MFAHARCFNRGMSEQVIELLPELRPLLTRLQSPLCLLPR